jgi:hypothetical protein
MLYENGQRYNSFKNFGSERSADRPFSKPSDGHEKQTFVNLIRVCTNVPRTAH